MSIPEAVARPTESASRDDPAIACVQWPSEASRREALARAGVPRLLFVEPGHLPPESWAPDEDWIRVPATSEEVVLRADTLRRRLSRRTPAGG